MGCTSSKQFNDTTDAPVNNNGSSMKNNPLTEDEILMRMDAPAESMRMVIDGVSIRYAWVCQRGYYPEALDKENQDSYIALPTLNNNKDFAFFGVYDGHGKDGHLCSRFARDKLHKTFLEKLEKVPGNINSKTIKQALTVAHYTTNEVMHADTTFDDSLSGTTALSVLFRGKDMYVCNVGDSRAIIISKSPVGERDLAVPLSSDQTPYRKDERERVKKYGARVLSMDQIEGVEPIHENWGDLNLGEDIDEGGDPPRVWSPNGDYPGTAFTRSLGDLFAEECGVVAEPEILVRELTANDKCIIIASDGVFEFLTNQMIADIVARYDDPLQACKAVTSAAYDMWLQYEVRTDDITIIALFVDDFRVSSSRRVSNYSSTSSFFVPTNVDRKNQIATAESRPVRRVISREKRKNMIQLTDDYDEIVQFSEDVNDHIPKNPEEVATIATTIKHNFLFQHLTASQRSSVINLMIPVQVKAGDWIIRQGDKGDRFYVIDSGKFEVRVKPTKITGRLSISSQGRFRTSESDICYTEVEITPEFLAMEQEEKDLELAASNVVHVYESGPDQHPGFGELSLMYGKPRAASVIALTDGKLWALDRRVFKKVVLKPKDMRKDTIRALRRVDMFKCLNLQQLQRLTDLLVESSYSAGDVIVQKGVPLSAFYIIMTGYCALLREDQKLGDPDVTKLIDLDCFGEKSLFDTVEADVSLVAGNDVKVLAITRVAFEEALGPMEKLQAEARIKKNLVVKTEINAPNSLSEVHLQGLVGVDVLGPIMLGTFSGLTPNLSVRSFVLADVEEKGIHQSVKQYIDAVEIVSANLSNNFINALIPRHISILRSPNALHLVFACPIVADLSGLIRTRGDDFDISNDVIVYIVSCIASALETLHGMNIIYRAVQPESLCVDSSGRVVLIDYRVCKLGVVGYSAKTYTICGAADYLAPEQIAQTGHSYPVDLWCLGVLMYELLVGSHPFSSSSEVATFSKISSFGSKTFQTLKFPENISADAKSLINQLLMPVPEARVGAGPNGFSNLKKHAFFKTGMDWDLISAGSSLSPLMGIAEEEMNDITKDGIDQEILSNFDVPYTGSDWHDGLEF